MLESELEDGVVAVQSKLLTDAGAVVLDRAVVNEELAGDFLARLAARNHAENPALGGGQIGEAWLALFEFLHAAAMAEEVGRERGGHVVLPGGDSSVYLATRS